MQMCVSKTERDREKRCMLQILESESCLRHLRVCAHAKRVCVIEHPHTTCFVIGMYRFRWQGSAHIRGTMGDPGPSHSAEIMLAREKRETSSEKNSLPWH